MNNRRLGVVLLVVLLVSAPLCASQLVEHEENVTFPPDGSVLRTTLLQAVVENDPFPWAPPPFVLQDDETLEEFSAEVVDGRRRAPRLERIRHFTETLSVEGTLGSTLAKHWFGLPRLRQGATVSVRYSTRSTPLFPEGMVEIPLDDPCRSARIIVSNPPPGFRYRVSQDRRVMVGEGPSGVTVTRSPSCRTGVANQQQTALVLNFAWGPARSWSELGGLYEQQLERSSAGTQTGSYARALLNGVSGNAEDRVDVLYRFVKAKVRYVAVERGVGWYLPASPPTVLTRGWGDCKEKALLLVKLLEEVGIEAYVALVDSAPAELGEQVDPAFPRLSAFNHAIVAVAEESIQSGGEGGWVFLDPTLDATNDRALDPVLVGRSALVMRDSGRSSLERVRTRGAILNLP